MPQIKMGKIPMLKERKRDSQEDLLARRNKEYKKEKKK